jgi:hypothetical protein
MKPSLHSFAAELGKTAEDPSQLGPRVVGRAAAIAQSRPVGKKTFVAQQKKSFIPNSALKVPGGHLTEDEASKQEPPPQLEPTKGINVPDRPGTISPNVRVRPGRDIEFHGGSQYQVPPGFKGEAHPDDQPQVNKPTPGPAKGPPKGTVIPYKAFPPGQHYTEYFKQASPGRTPSLHSFADELTKTADIAKIVRLLKTPIPGTPKLFMKVRPKEVLQAEEHALREKLRDKINDNIYKVLKKTKVDRLYQKLEPVLGSKTAPKELRDTFGERQIHEIAHRPFHWLLGKAPIPYISSAHNILSEGHQKLLKVPPPRSYVMPGEAAKALEKAVEQAPPSKRSELLKKLKSTAGMAAVVGTPSAAIMANQEN